MLLPIYTKELLLLLALVEIGNIFWRRERVDSSSHLISQPYTLVRNVLESLQINTVASSSSFFFQHKTLMRSHQYVLIYIIFSFGTSSFEVGSPRVHDRRYAPRDSTHTQQGALDVFNLKKKERKDDDSICVSAHSAKGEERKNVSSCATSQTSFLFKYSNNQENFEIITPLFI